MQIKVAGTGRALPAERVTSLSLDMRLGLAPGTLQSATGVVERYVCVGESQIDLAAEASRIALADAGLEASDVTLVISACSVPYQPLPATAPIVMRRLGMKDGSAAAFDVNSTCLSFLTAADIAAHIIAAGSCETALVFSSEVASRALPWEDQPKVAALFGDGAAAAVLRKAGPGEGSFVANLMRTYPSAYEACSIGSGGTRFDFRLQQEEFARNAIFHMDGKELFRVTLRHFRNFVADLLARAGWRAEEVDLIVPHQASPVALSHMAREVGFSPERLVDLTAHHGNQIAASIPFALDVARRQGRIATGSKVLFLGTSAGVSFGGLAIEA